MLKIIIPAVVNAKPQPNTAMPKQTALSAKQERFAAAYAKHHNASLACREAGYSAHGRSASVTGTRLLADVCVLGRIQTLEAASAQELGVTRQRFLYELQEAATLAKERREPAAMIAAWREIGKACGFYAVETKRVELSAAGHGVLGRLESMTDAELVGLIASGDGGAVEH
jgi:hypothetical protein